MDHAEMTTELAQDAQALNVQRHQIRAAYDDIGRLEYKARSALLREHNLHFRALRAEVEAACQLIGHEVRMAAEPVDFDLRFCAHCHKHFPRWSRTGLYPPGADREPAEQEA